jgi:hypothetical protein
MSLVIWYRSEDSFITYAAQELEKYLVQLYQESVEKSTAAQCPAADTVVALGECAEELSGEKLALSEDELSVVVRKAGATQQVLLRGGSPKAIRNAAYRFLEECGVLFDLQDDYLPDPREKCELAEMEIRETPLIPLHGPHLWINFPMDPSAYTRAQWMRYVEGCARMRFSVFGLHFYDTFPWYDVDLQGFKDQSGFFFYSKFHSLPHLPELGYAIHNDAAFVAPEVESFIADTPRVYAWAQETIRLVMARAHELGMKVSVTFEPLGEVPEPYQKKLTEMNGGIPVDPRDSLHPLRQEYALAALRSILSIYPDIDIIKLVSGEGGTAPGTEEELTERLKEMLGGELTGTSGKALDLPKDKPNLVGLILAALASCKLSCQVVQTAKERGIIPKYMEVAIGCYPAIMEAVPFVFETIGKVVPDPAIKLHFLPSYGMKAIAEAVANAGAATFAGRKLEISGWSEFDGVMYYPQSQIQAIAMMRDQLECQPIDALYVIHWRVAGTTFSNSYFSRTMWNRQLAPKDYAASLAPIFGAEVAGEMLAILDHLEKITMEGYAPLGFCFYYCWLPIPKRAEDANAFPDLATMEKMHLAYQELAAQAAALAPRAVSEDGRRLLGYLANKIECALIHIDYIACGSRLQNAFRACADPDQPTLEEKKTIQTLAQDMLEKSYEYLRHYQKFMFDRGDEGMLASYYMTACRYAYRYLHPEEDDTTGKYSSLLPWVKLDPETQETVILAPDV